VKSKIKKKVKILQKFLKDDWKLFGGLNAIFAFGFGLYGYTSTITLDHLHFYLTTPFLTYFILGFAWKLTFKKKNDYSLSELLVIVLTFVPLVHFLTYLILVYFHLISENIAPNEYSYFNSYGSFLYYFIASFTFTFVSIYKLYFSTLAIPMIIGILINKNKT